MTTPERITQAAEISEKDIQIIQSTNYGKIAVVWQGPGTYYQVPKMGLWFRINCRQVAEYVANKQVETIEL